HTTLMLPSGSPSLPRSIHDKLPIAISESRKAAPKFTTLSGECGIRRRDFITLLGGTAVMWPLPVHAQQLSIPLIGFMSARSPEDSVNALQAFHKGLKDEGGFTNGENVNVEYRWARGNYGLLPALAE